MTTDSRIRKLRESLGPSLAVLDWHQQCIDAGDPLEYFRAYHEALKTKGSRDALVDKVVRTARTGKYARSKTEMDCAGSRVGRETLFLIALLDIVNSEAVDAWDGRTDRSILLTYVTERLTTFLADQSRDPSVQTDVELAPHVFAHAASDVFGSGDAAQRVSDGYFGGRPILFAGARTQLKLLRDCLELAIEAYNDVVDEPINLASLRSQLARRTFDYWAACAQSNMLVRIGRREQAQRTLLPLLRQAMSR